MFNKPTQILGLHNGMVSLKEAIELLEEPLDESSDEEDPLARLSNDWEKLVSSYNELVRILKHRHPQWRQEFEYLVDVEGRVLW